MIELPLSEVARVTSGRLDGVDPAVQVTAEVEVDSRQVRPGGLFVALPGERTDGHDHAAEAVRAGAVAAVVERPLAGLPCVVVPDPLGALQALAAQVFGVDQPLTYGITGSSGKTSTKDLLAHVLAGCGPTLAPVGSFNNEVGLPLTALRRTVATAYAVLEYSARGAGHLAFLCGIVRPDVAVELNVGSAHLGEFGSRQATAQAKGELVEAARRLVVLNADDPLVLAMRARAGVPVVTFGTGPDADVRAEHVSLDDDGLAAFRLATPAGTVPVRLGMVGDHHVANALAVAAAVTATDVAGLDVLAERLGSARPVSRWRMEVSERPDGVTVVNDAYNANPDSMRAALRTLAVLGRRGTRRTVAVLGPMAELGDAAREEHMDLGRFAVRLDIGQLVVVGPDAGGIHAGAVLEGSWGSESLHVDDPESAVALLREQLRPGDVVLVKASRSAGLERVADALLEGAS